MSLKNCEDCGQAYSKKADKCIHCGSPNQNEEDDWGDVIERFIVIGVIGWFIYVNSGAIGKFLDQLLTAFNVGVVSEQNFKNCHNERIKISMKHTFDESQYAQSLHLKAIIVDAQQVKAGSGYILSCNARITLNNSQTLGYTFNFSKQGDQYLIEATPY